MDATDRVPPLRLWSSATFHSSTFVLALVIVFHVSGSLPWRLAMLNTESGLGLFVMLWITTWFASHAQMPGETADRPHAIHGVG